MMTLLKSVMLVTALIVALPRATFAQASLAGVVKDTSGAVLPGVTVEASSTALIEKVRSVVTDNTGQYKIVDLRPGAYTVTFGLTGFSTVKREGIELTGSGTVTVNAELKVGTLEETITVTGETPVVDVQSARRQAVLSGELVANAPAARSWNGIMLLMPGVTGDPNTVQLNPSMILFGIHGGPAQEGRLLVDGMNVGASRGGAGVSGYAVDTGNVTEVTFATSGGLGEAETGGPYMNVVPKAGGNTFKGSFVTLFTNSSLQSSNYTQELRDAGLRVPGEVLKNWDLGGAFGGPIKKDRLWFFLIARNFGQGTSVPGMYANANAGNPNAWTYVPDLTLQARNDTSRRTDSARLTWQVTPRNKLNLFWDDQRGCSGAAWLGTTASACRDNAPGWIQGGSATRAPETEVYSHGPSRVAQVTWTSPLSNRILLDVGWSEFGGRWGGTSAPGSPTKGLIQVQEQAGSIPNLCYRAGSPLCGGTFLDSTGWIDANTWHATLSYVTGAHNVKVGYHGLFHFDNQQSNFANAEGLAYRFNNGVPNQLTELSGFFDSEWRTRGAALFAQDQWTLNRLTVQGALRYERAWSYYPPSRIGGTRFIPVATVIPYAEGVNFHDVSPRVGAAYDVFGTGKTSLKVNWGRYLYPAQNGGIFTGAAPTSQIATSAARSWTDANGNFTPDCNLQDVNAQDLRASGGDFCGGVANRNFGTLNAGLTYSDELLNGLRPWDTQIGVAVQQQIVPRVSLEVQFNKRWWYGQYVTRNLAVQASNFTKYSITAPSDARLPAGGGYPISGLYDVDPTLFGVVNYQVQPAGNYGNQSLYWNGVDVTLSMRPVRGVTFQGGTSTGQTVSDFCEVASKVPESLVAPQTVAIGVSIPGPTGLGVAQSGAMPSQYCHLESGFLTQFRGIGSYHVPKIDVELTATLQSKPGTQLAANFNVPAATVAQSLGRAPSGGVANVTVNLVTPGTLYGDRINELDLRIAKVFRISGTQTKLSVDLFNALNSAAVIGYNQTYSPTTTTWLTPTSVLGARIAKIGVSFDF